MEKFYHEQRRLNYIRRTKSIAEELPEWFSDFLRGIAIETSESTRYMYAIDTKVFLRYLHAENKSIAGTPIDKISAQMLSKLKLKDFEKYIEFLDYYVTEDEIEFQNSERGKARKVANLRSLFKYLYKAEYISSNPTTLLPTPKIHEKAIVRLLVDEVSKLIDCVESGDGLTDRQKMFHQLTVKRDIAICVLFLTTGIRISELVGLDIGDVDLKNYSFLVRRKGGNEAMLYFDEETAESLKDYLLQRERNVKLSPSEPLFLSLKGTRISIRQVQYLVKKYAKIISPLKKITPHKLRSTYGSMLYNETGDIYLVADVLGHKDVNTTKKHYAAIDEDRRRSAAKAVKIKSDT